MVSQGRHAFLLPLFGNSFQNIFHKPLNQQQLYETD